MPKLFFALSPDPTVRERIIQHRNRFSIAGRLSKDNNIHLTVLYLGKLSVNQQQKIIDCANRIQVNRFELQLNHIDYFKHNKITWMGVKHIPPELSKLHHELSECGKSIELELEKRAFKPHLTLARKALLEKKHSFTCINWPVNQFVLYESKQQADGVLYECIKTFNFKEKIEHA